MEQVYNYEDLLFEVARVLRPQGMFLACEWGVAAIYGEHPVNALPNSHRFFRALNNCFVDLDIRPVVPHLEYYLHQTGQFTDIQTVVHLVPVGEGHDSPVDRDTGRAFLPVMSAYAESMGVVMERAGRGTAEVTGLVRGLIEEMHTVRGMVWEYYTVYARKI